MVINQFITKNVSEDPEKKQLVIMKDEDKYTVDDLVFISQFVDDDDEDEYDEEETEVETNDETESDDDKNPDWLAELMNGN
jgi:hypothetical protein